MQKDNLNFKKACDLCVMNLSHEDFICMLKTGSVIERQYAALNLESINSTDEAGALLSNLVGVDGKIRDAAALKILELTETMSEYFFSKAFYNKFSQATIDIDGNVCRLAINSAKNLSFNKDFSISYTKDIVQIINNCLVEISKFTFRDKKYKINKQVFKIYWCLDALEWFYKFLDEQSLYDILEKCSNLQEYTIREKCARILLNINQPEKTKKLIEKLKNDENYYVRSILNN